jgi:transcriptional regulator with XRE-family HTH domain
MADIGATLRDARMRARIDVSDIESQTKIRAKYLRALENEEWDLLPGPTYVRSFLRTYAEALGVDPRPLLEEYRHDHERPTEVELTPISPPGSRQRSAAIRGGVPRGYLIAVGVLLVVILLAVIGLLSGGSSHAPTASTPKVTRRPHRTHRARGAVTAPRARATSVSLQLAPTAPVYVCLIGTGGRKLIDKVTLQPGTHQPVYHARRFEITLGNSSVTMRIDGRTVTVPPSSNATGYVITPKGRRTLSLGQLPTCA